MFERLAGWDSHLLEIAGFHGAQYFTLRPSVGAPAASSAQEIAASDMLMVLEAMKMGTEITSPKSGKFAMLNINPGYSVKGGHVLVELK